MARRKRWVALLCPCFEPHLVDIIVAGRGKATQAKGPQVEGESAGDPLVRASMVKLWIDESRKGVSVGTLSAAQQVGRLERIRRPTHALADPRLYRLSLRLVKRNRLRLCLGHYPQIGYSDPGKDDTSTAYERRTLEITDTGKAGTLCLLRVMADVFNRRDNDDGLVVFQYCPAHIFRVPSSGPIQRRMATIHPRRI